MAGEVRRMISDYLMVTRADDDEITVDDINEHFQDKFSRKDITNVLKDLEDEGQGVRIIGRRDKPTRFSKSLRRELLTTDTEGWIRLKSGLDQLNDGESLSLKEIADTYFSSNTILAADCLKRLQRDGYGSFVIGRRGGISRFVKGREQKVASRSFVRVNSANQSSSTTGTPQVIKNTLKKCYFISNDMIVKTEVPENNIPEQSFPTFADALDATNKTYADIDAMEQKIEKDGFVQVSQYS